jgi:predicted PurR-regulated permease PerM
MVTAIAALFLIGQVWGILGQFSDILLIIFLAWLLSFILDPLVGYLTKYGLPRPAATSTVYLVVGGLLVLVGLFVTPVLVDQTKVFVSEMQISSDQTPAWVWRLQESLISYGITVDLSSIIRSQVQAFQGFSAATFSQTLNVATSILSSLFYTFLVLFFSFFFVLDGERLWRKLLKIVPANYHNELQYVKNTISFSFAGFLRTQVLMGALMGIGTLLLLFLFGVPYSLTAASFAGLAMIIPILGPFLAVVPPLLVTW